MRISVVTPSFNQGAFLRETLESVHSQGYPDLEHWVLDGGSTDASVQILQEYAHRGLLQFVSEPDAGQSDALNKGFARCRGQIVCWLCSDDLFTAGALHKVATFFARHPEAQMLTGDCLFIDQTGRPLSRGVSRGVTREKLIRVEQSLFQPSTFFRRELLQRHGRLDERYHYALDYELWLRFTRQVEIHYLPEVLSCYRLHPASKSSMENYQTFLPEVVRASRQHWGSPLSPRYWSRLLAVSGHCSRVYYEAALSARARAGERPYLRLLSKAFLHAPWRLLYWRDLLGAVKSRMRRTSPTRRE